MPIYSINKGHRHLSPLSEEQEMLSTSGRHVAMIEIQEDLAAIVVMMVGE